MGKEAHRLAEQFARQQATPQKGKRVYLNTLAVYAVHSYLKWLQIETNLHQSDSWHSGMQAIFDVADLVLPGIGKLECRPILPGETAFYLPLEATENRIGYVGVQFSESLSEVQLLGFAPAVDAILPPEQLPKQLQISDFQPLDALIDNIYQRKIQISVLHSETLVNLSQWFQNVFEGAWQNIEELLSPAQLSLGSNRSTETDSDQTKAVVRRAKSIDLGMQLAGHSVALVVELAPETNQRTGIRLRVYPNDDQTYLPPNLQLTVLDDSEKAVLEAKARAKDNWIQLQFYGMPRTRFSVKVALGDAGIRENFVI